MKNVNPAISVIIPVYNTRNFLPRCLESVCGQTLGDLEIICINDGSNDGSEEIINDFASHDRRIITINLNKNRGVSVSRNLGILTARGEWLGFVDSDDVVEANFFENLCNANNQSSPDIIKGMVWNERNLPYYINYEYNLDINKNKFNFRSEWCSAIYKKNLIRSNNIYFNENCFVGEDRVFLTHALIHAIKIKTNNDALYKYYYRDNSSDSKFYTIEKLKSLALAQNIICEYLNNHSLPESTYINEFLNTILNFILISLSHRYNNYAEACSYITAHFICLFNMCKNKSLLLNKLGIIFSDIAKYLNHNEEDLLNIYLLKVYNNPGFFKIKYKMLLKAI